MSSIHDHLPQFNKHAPEYRSLIGDPDRPELEPVQNITDLNRGALENCLLWSNRFQERAIREKNLQNATGLFLELWAEILGFERPAGLDDVEFRGTIVGRILSSLPGRPALAAILPRPRFKMLRARETGFTAGHSCAGVGPVDPDARGRRAAAVVTHTSNATYAYADNLADFDREKRSALKAILAAGFDVFVRAH